MFEMIGQISGLMGQISFRSNKLLYKYFKQLKTKSPYSCIRTKKVIVLFR